MFLAFRVRLVVGQQSLSYGWSIIQSRINKIGKSWQGDIRPIISQLENHKLLVYFHLARISKFFDSFFLVQ